MKQSSSFAAFFCGAILLGLVGLITIYTGLENFDVALAFSHGSDAVIMVGINYLACLTGTLLVRYAILSKVALDGF